MVMAYVIPFYVFLITVVQEGEGIRKADIGGIVESGKSQREASLVARQHHCVHGIYGAASFHSLHADACEGDTRHKGALAQLLRSDIILSVLQSEQPTPIWQSHGNCL